MGLIDWAFVARNTLWLLGLSLALAAWSYASWQAGIGRTPLRQALALPSFVLPFCGGLLLLACGMAWSTGQGWLRLGWAGFGLIALWPVIGVWRQRRTG